LDSSVDFSRFVLDPIRAGELGRAEVRRAGIHSAQPEPRSLRRRVPLRELWRDLDDAHHARGCHDVHDVRRRHCVLEPDKNPVGL
jgi:hypothetical protein